MSVPAPPISTKVNLTRHTRPIGPLWFFSVEQLLWLILTGIAKACEQNLRRTFQYGGRVQCPNNMELRAILVSHLEVYRV